MKQKTLIQVAQANFRRRLVGAIALPLGLMLLLTIALLGQLKYLLEVTEWLNRADQAIAQANQTQKLLLDLETGARGYLLSGEDNFLAPYEKSEKLIDAAFNQLKNLVSHNQVQIQLIKDLETNYQQWDRYTNWIIDTRQSNGNYQIYHLKATKQLMDKMRTQLASLIEIEEKKRDRTSQQAQNTTQIVITTSIALALGLGSVLALFSKRQLTEVANSYKQAMFTLDEQKGSIQKSEESFRLLVDNVKDYAIFMLDPKGFVVSWNSGAQRLKGYEAEEIIGQHFSKFFRQEDIADGKPERELLLAVVKGHTEDEGWRVRKDGSLFWANVVVTALRDSEGNLRGFAKITRDFTDRKQADEILRKSLKDLSELKLALDQAAIVVTTDASGVITEANDNFCRISQYSREELIGKTHRVINSGYHSTAFFKNLWETISSGQVWQGEIKNKAKDGSYYWVATTIIPLLNEAGKPRQYLAIRFDITERKQAEAARLEIEHQFQSTFNQAAVGIAQVGIDGKWLLINQKLAEIVGYSHEELLKLSFQDITYPEDLETDLDYVRKTLADEIQTYSMEKRYIRKDGSLIWINLTVSLVRELSGEPKYFIAVIEDISIRKHAEESLRRAAKRLESLHEIDRAILAANSSAELVHAAIGRMQQLVPFNQAMIVLFNWETDVAEVLAVTIDGILDLQAGTKMPLEDFISKSVLNQESSQYWSDISKLNQCPPILKRYVNQDVTSCLKAPLIAEGKLIGELILIAFQAIAFNDEHRHIAIEVSAQLAIAIQQASLRQELQNKAQYLDQRVQERTIQLQKANEELEAFAYSVSHDLRAPLRAMEGFAQALSEDYADKLDKLGHEYAQRIITASQGMETLIHDLLNYSHLSRSEIRLGLVDLKFLLDEVLLQLQSDLQQKQAQIIVEPPLPQVLAHRTTLIQVITNLLTNAIKFVKPGIKPQIRIWAEEGQSNGENRQPSTGEKDTPNHLQTWRLWIEDNGIGIKPEHQERIFRVFERLHGIETYPGTGIGLAIVRKGIERMGGKVGLESQIGQGSRFWIEFPSSN